MKLMNQPSRSNRSTGAGKPRYYMKKNRIFSRTRRISWLLVPLFALGALYLPLLGLGVLGIMIIITGTGFFQGRFFCGRLCPHGSLFDRFMLPLSLNRKIPSFFTSPVTKWGFFSLYMVMFALRIGQVVPLWGDLEFLHRLGDLMGIQYLAMPTVAGITLSFLNPRTWCTVCPMGTFGEVLHNAGTALKANRSRDRKLTLSNPEKCISCGICARVCPMQLSPYTSFDDKGQFSNSACLRCGVCAAHCPPGILSFANADEAEQFTRSEAPSGNF
ncbi:4Fe-4S binding domain-containing protein [Alkalispirochaeta americana]|uniref:4Fe-4S binding domain-containing protein n=1 Tax=Alkalispirochaeta americana TaxID=159291 RepID=A0A1N6WW22_9SPIO|nr:4Fe-4S binding protein [Alkalispirochaeta americana]SIQ94314.1 4Fe-4S binding domain-containing protein [Alkalispirochaeta americana]